jgi:molybdopterin synthase catalytic subunit
VRADISGEGRTGSIEYSAYNEMVEKAVAEIQRSLFNKYDDLISIGIWHSTGLVRVGEVSLLVLVSSGHRKHAFAALEECVELIKEKLPVWKKENFSDGSHNWTNS